MSQPLKVSVYGHSFVRRLSEFVQSDSDHMNLGLDFATFEIGFYGQGGLSLNHRLLESFDESLRGSDILFVDLGSNDLCPLDYSKEKKKVGTSSHDNKEKKKSENENLVEDLADQLVSFIARKKSSLSVKVLVLGQILHRFIEPYEGYNENVDTLNKLLFQKINTPAYQSLKIFFWRHQCGLWGLDNSDYRPDGIHLSWNRGYPKYFRSVRDCILRMKNKLS